MQPGTTMRLVLAALAAAGIAILTVLLLWRSDRTGISSWATDDAGRAEAVRPADPLGASAQESAAGRVPVSTSQSEDAAVQGKVCDAAGTPLAGVLVTARLLEKPRTIARSETLSDHTGGFVLALPPQVPIELAFYNSGYRPKRERVHAPQSGIDVLLERSPTLRGRVVRADGTPVNGALVRWSNPQLALEAGDTTSTGTDGRFAFLDVPWSLDLEVLAPDALPAHRFVLVTWNLRELIVTVEEGREATGAVVDPNSGAGIAGATVELWYYQSTYTAEGRRGGPVQHAESVTTRADGSFTLTRLPRVLDKTRPDAWLWATAPGRAPHWKLVASPDRAAGMRIALHPAGSVRGRVVDASGTAVAGQRVFAEARVQPLCDAGPNDAFRRQDGGYSIMWNTRRPEPAAPFHTEREAFTDADGAYVIERIPCPAGGGEVTLALPAGRPHVKVVAWPGEVAVAEDLVRPAGQFHGWHGVVQDENARPIAGATIEIGVARTTADARGRFDFTVPSISATREIRASAPGHVSFRGIAPQGEDGDVTITLARGHRLKALVTDRVGHPVPDVSVQFFPEGALSDLATGGPKPIALGRGYSDDRGVVMLDGVPATCDVLIEPVRSHVPTHRKLLEGVAAGAGILRVRLEDLDIVSGTADLIVRAIDARTEDAFEGMVLVEATSEEGTARRLAQGPEVRLDRLSCGDWEVRVVAEGHGTRVERVALLDDRRLDIRFGQGIVISGQVTCAAGPLARPVQVSARELTSKHLSVARTDISGHFTLAGMQPGEYLLSVEPFESDAFAQWPMRTPQDHASPAPVKVRVGEGTAPAPVTLPVVPVAPLTVTVAPDASSSATLSVWSWAQGLRFTVTDEQGRSVYAGGPTGVTAAAAELLLRLSGGGYTVRVRARGHLLGERTLMAGDSWRLKAR